MTFLNCLIFRRRHAKLKESEHRRLLHSASTDTLASTEWDSSGLRPRENRLVIRVLSAELDASDQVYGELAARAVVKWVKDSGSKRQIGQTRPDYTGNLYPKWDHACEGQVYRGNGSGDRIEFRVVTEHLGGLKTHFHGGVSIYVDALLDVIDGPGGQGDPSLSKSMSAMTPTAVCKLVLQKKGKARGTITVHAILRCPTIENHVALGMVTRVDPNMFDTPCKRLGVSGGTAPFFNISLLPGKEQPSQKYGRDLYIGKDLSRAQDEIIFYEEALRLSKEPGKAGFGGVFAFLFDYLGVLTIAADDQEPGEPPKELLVLRNLRSSTVNLRMLDLKIGQVTAVAGWQGKSKTAAFKQWFIDGLTNSGVEGYRLEGFDGPPPVVVSMHPVILLQSSARVQKRAFRMMLQRMTSAEVFAHFFDVHQTPEDPGEAKLESIRAPIEVAEIVSHEIVRRLRQLALGCRHVPVPQKWIGSSVALGFDCGRLVPRDQSEAETRSMVRVNIFDWGRSELNTVGHHELRSLTDQEDRSKFWAEYVHGIDRLTWEAARSYLHRFGNARGWKKAHVALYDFDSMSQNDFMGQVSVPLMSTREMTANLQDMHGGLVKTRGGFCTVTYSVRYRRFPASSRLHGAWRIKIVRADNLPAMDANRSSDPFAVVTAVSPDGTLRFRQQTSVKSRCLSPVWHETLEIPVSTEMSFLSAALGKVGEEPLHQLLPSEESPEHDVEEGLKNFIARLDQAGRDRTFSAPRFAPRALRPPMAAWHEPNDRDFSAVPDRPDDSTARCDVSKVSSVRSEQKKLPHAQESFEWSKQQSLAGNWVNRSVDWT